MADYRPIKTRMWRDGWFSQLSDAEKVVWFFLLTNEHLHVSGIYELQKALVSPYTGVNDAEKIIEKFETDGKIVYREGFFFIVNYLKNQTKQFDKRDNIVKSVIAYLRENPKIIELFNLLDRDPYKALLSPSYDPWVNRKWEIGNRKEEILKKETPSVVVSSPRQKKPESSIAWLANIPPEETTRIAERHNVEEKLVQARAQDVTDYCQAKGKTYADYRAALHNFIKSHIAKYPDSVRKPPSQSEVRGQEIAAVIAESAVARTPEEQIAYEKKMNALREEMKKIGIGKHVGR